MEELKIIRDKSGREIVIYQDHDAIVAKHEDQKIGEFDFRSIDEPEETGLDLELWGMEIKIGYRKLGIGQEMMKVAVDIYQDFKLPSAYAGSREGRPENYLTTEGATLIQRCFEKGILPEKFKKYIFDGYGSNYGESDSDENK